MKTKLVVVAIIAFLSTFSGYLLSESTPFPLSKIIPQEMIDKYKQVAIEKENGPTQEFSLSLLADDVARTVIGDPKLSVALLEIEHAIEREDIQATRQALSLAKTALYDIKKVAGCMQSSEKKNCSSEMSSLLGRVESTLMHIALRTDQRASQANAVGLGCCSSTCNPVTVILQVDLPATISASGHYCVGQDLSWTSESVPAITITASEVELSLDLHVIDVTGTDIGILVDGSTAAIQDIQIAGCGEIENANIACIQIQGATNVHVDNLILDSSLEAGILIQDSSNYVIIDHVVIRSCAYGVFTTASDVLSQSANIEILNCELRDNTADAINIFGVSENLAIENCVIYSNEGTGIVIAAASQMDQILIKNCFIGTNYSGMDLSFGCQNCLVQNVMVQDTKSDGIFIQNASNLTLENCLVDLIQGRGIRASFGAKNLHIKNCEVSNTTQSPFEAISIIDGIIEDSIFYTVADNQIAGMNMSRSDNCIIRNCLIKALLSDPTMALDPYINLVTGTNGLTLQNCHGFIIESNQIQTNAQTTNEIDGAGILLYGGNRDCVIRDCIVYNDALAPASRGIAIIDSPMNATNTAVTVENCTISGATRNGLFVQGLQDSILQNNMVSTTSQGTGMTIKVGDGIAILGNLIMHNGHHGLHLSKGAQNCAVRDNTSYGNGKVGIKAHESGKNSSSGASSSSNQTNAIYHNFSYSNGEKNFVGVDLVVHPKRHIGVLENISG